MDKQVRRLTIDDYDEMIRVWSIAGLTFKPTGRESRELLEAELGREFAAAMLRMLGATAEIVRGHSDHVWSLKVDTDGFAMAATASGELESGVTVRISRCLLITVHDGRITRICEFGDRQQRAPLDDALRAAGRFRS